MMIFAAIYFYFLIQLIMSWKWTESLSMSEIKDKITEVPATVNEKTKIVKKKITDGSDSIKQWVKTITEKTTKNLKKWKDFVVETYNDIKTKISNISVKSKDKGEKSSTKWNTDNDAVSELVKSNKELIDLVTKLVDKYDESLKLLEEINKNLSKKK